MTSKETKRFKRAVNKNYQNSLKLIFSDSAKEVESQSGVSQHNQPPESTFCQQNPNLDEDLEEVSSVNISASKTFSISTNSSESNDNYLSNVTTNVLDAASTLEFLRTWALRHNITHSAVSELLKTLGGHSCFSSFPSDARTLLQTPRYSNVKDIAPGQYIKFNWQSKVRLFLKKNRGCQAALQLNVDGISVFNSSPLSFWPILCAIKDQKEIFSVGIWLGKGKPERVNDFLSDFVEDFLALQNELGPEILKISAFICDAPARSFISGIKNHTGYFGCAKCVTKGRYLENRICFPETGAPLRTDDSFRSRRQSKHHNESTLLIKLPMDMVMDIPYEYMHLICLGVTRKLLHLWISAKKSPVRLARHLQGQLNERLLRAGKYTPTEFARRSRSLNELDHWKATELRQFLLYTGPVILKNIVPVDQYQNFLCLSIATRLLLGSSTYRLYNDYAHSLFSHFVKCFGVLYGLQYISYNVHGLLHVAADSLAHGPLDDYSAFKYENHLQKLKNLVRSPYHALQQVHNRVVELEQIAPDSECLGLQAARERGREKKFQSEQHFSSYKTKTAHFKLNKRDSCVQFSSGEVGVIQSFARKGNDSVVIVKPFKEKSNYFVNPCSSSLVNIHLVSLLEEETEKNVEDILCKIYLVPVETDFISVPIIHCE